ncbi:MAG: flagellar hook-length control protein FliK [Cycloclasticus sp.]|jgi:flagellar hook-length control protein FliK|nr:flagellar hook-length control protein FliK [Cycloclasticus sp.]
MEVPAMLSPQLGHPTSSGADITKSDSSKSGNHGFSEHLEKNVDRLDTRRTETSSVSGEKPGKLGKPKVLANGENEQKVTTTADAVDTEEVESEQILAFGVDVSKVAASGNELPQAADLGAIFNDGQDGNSDLSNKAIVFDPLSQAKESSVQIAALTAGHLTSEKVRFNGKSSTSEFFNSTPAVLSLDKSQHTEVLGIHLGRVQKTMPDTNSIDALTKEVSAVNVAKGPDSSLSNMAVLMTGAGQIQQPSTDRASLQLDTPISNPKWAENFSQRVQWVVNQSMSGAQIRLNPQHMGPVEVRIHMQNDQATVSFTAQHGATREAIDAALPRLREMLSEQNVNVVDIDVSQHSFAEQRDQASKNQEGEQGQVNEFAQEDEGALFDGSDNQLGRKYNGLFSEFA